ncbi:hypothetical protein F4804DRAFT_346531 [Jackrogersella minutella]|nr:hypothetical protein F4804DRAFT_346531 [Jackrogersella minutella]
MTTALRKAIGAVLSIASLGSAIPFERCERTCLEGLISDYLNALIAHDPSKLPTTPDVRYNGVGAIYDVRLKVERDGIISEIETQKERIPRDVLISQTNKYYSDMQGTDPNDGLQTTSVKTGDSYGHSNDTVFASLTCEEQFQTGFLGFVTKIRERHFSMVNKERQAVFAITTLDHNGTVRSLPNVNGTFSPIPLYFETPRTLIFMEASRLRGEKLYRIEMTLTEVPYGMKTGLPEDPPVDLSGPGTNYTIYPEPCDVICLENVVGDVVIALRVHDPTRFHLAKDVHYSENGQFFALGDGLWETLEQVSWVDSYAAILADDERHTAGYWGFFQEHTVPSVLALRVKVGGGHVTEIEALAVRAEATGSRGRTVTLIRPPLPVEWEGDETAGLDITFQERSDDVDIPPELLNGYIDGLEKHSSERVLVTPGCTRRDNFAQTDLTCADQLNGKGVAPNGLPNGTTTKRGIALAVALIDEPADGPNPLPKTTRIPSTYMIPHLIKIDDGTISRIESVIKWMPYGYTFEWSKLKERKNLATYN